MNCKYHMCYICIEIRLSCNGCIFAHSFSPRMVSSFSTKRTYVHFSSSKMGLTSITTLIPRGGGAIWKVRGLRGGTFFRATFYCIFGPFGKMTHLVNFKKWGGSSLAPSAPPCAPPLIHSLCKHFRKKRKLIKYFSLYWHCTRRMPATVSDVLNSIKQFIAERFFGSPRARTQ